MPSRTQREWRAFERAMSRSKRSGRAGHPDMFVGRLLKGKGGTVKLDLGNSTTLRLIPEQK